MTTLHRHRPRIAALAGGLAVVLLTVSCGSRESGPDAVVEAVQNSGGGTGVSGNGDGGTGSGGLGTDGSVGGDIGTTSGGGDVGTTSGGPDTTGSGSAASSTGSGATTSGGGGQSPTSGSGGPGSNGGAATGGGKAYGDGSTSQGVTDSEIKLGVVAPTSGAAGFLGRAEIAGIRAYTSQVNAAGGVKGRKFSLSIRDSEFLPTKELAGARQLVDGDKVFALFSVLGDSSGPYVTSKGVPTMVFGLIPPAFSSKYNTMHVTGFSTVDSVVRMAYNLNVINKKGIKKVSILYDTQSLDLTPYKGVLQKGWEAAGAQVASLDAFNVSDTDCTALASRMRSQGIDFWQAGQGLAWPACLAALQRLGWKPAKGVGGPYSADSKYIAQGGQAAADGVFGQHVGVQFTTKAPGTPFPNGSKPAATVAPRFDEFVNSMKKYSPAEADVDTLESIWTQTFWVAAQALTRSIEAQTSGLSQKGVNDWLHDQKSYDSGLTAPINFDPKCKTGSPVYLYQWKTNGRSLFQTSYSELGGRFSMPTSFTDKVAPGGPCYLTTIADTVID